ncbi:MAG: efflux transporter outer membrane subunit [Methylomonas sp.]|jgi:NodT family efflux transporter outer membrane factor (OMF) lipoprotein|uniref:efflux transporter outer membrane subunit n=1 Tax=Methylomonas sp. TaxID=418 RepID=UPI0025D3EEA7|nr:efflux transporter outer membrane subunit [Methylomonas sp.]MCK9606037.1 efflux transporter outer membrane subunit [Methylomonas sp.]
MTTATRYPVRLIAALMLSAVSGCAWFGDETRRAEMMAVPAMSQTLANAESSLTDAAWPQAKWWESFNIPALNQLITTALADNPNFKAAAARLRQSQAMVDAQAAELYPTVDANVSFSAQRFSANSTQAKLAGENFRQLLINPLVLRYHLDFWGRDQAALEAAVGRSLAVETELADAKLLLATAVAASYFDLVAASEKLLIAENIVADREALLNLHQVRLTTGLVAEAPVLQAKMALQDARQQLDGLRAEVELQKHLLASLAGQGPDWGQHILAVHGVLPKSLALPADLSLRLLAHRPDVTAARLQAQAAAQEIKVAETGFYPDVNLLAFTGLHSVSLTDVLLQGASLAYAVGPSIEFPIFEGGRLRANLSYQEAAYDAAVERYNGSLLHAVQEVADALTRWREIDRRMAAQRQSVIDSVEAKDLAASLHRNGLNDRTDLMLADLEAHQQRLQLTALQGQHFKVAVQVIKALGGGFNDIKNDSQKLSYAH